MSNVENVTKFETLPNEILTECFEYLGAIEIINAFDYLNSRFYNLIRNIVLHLNIDKTTCSALTQFATEISRSPQIKEQVISLRLSDGKTFDYNENFYFHRRALIVPVLDETVTSQISSMLPLLTGLQYCYVEKSCLEIGEILTSLSTSAIKKLSIPELPDNLSLTHQFTSLVNLIVPSCFVDQLCNFLKYSPNVQHLRIGHLNSSYLRDKRIHEVRSLRNQAVHLKRLVLTKSNASFYGLKILVQQTPNLKFLMISTDDDTEKIHANNWRELIEKRLPSSYLSSIKVNKVFLIQMLNYQELCECFNKMIKKLDTIDGSWSFFNFEELSKVCQVFSNLEYFRCYIDKMDNLQMIINQLSQLTYMKTFSFKPLFYDTQKSWLNLNQFKTNSYAFTIKYEDDD